MAYQFTDFDSVRAALGLSAKELPNSVFESAHFNDRLLLDLSDLSDEIVDDYETATAESTVAATNFVAAFNLFAVYSYADYCASGLPQFSPRSVTDGKAGFTRFADSPYKTTLTKIHQNIGRYRRVLAEKYAIWKGVPLPAPTAPPRPFTASPLAIDPVTGV